VALASYAGAQYRTRFTSRLLMRRALDLVRQPVAAEAGLRVLALPPMRSLARHVFFGRGSFPDLPAREVPQAAAVARHA
jgi:hypothetical protein